MLLNHQQALRVVQEGFLPEEGTRDKNAARSDFYEKIMNGMTSIGPKFL